MKACMGADPDASWICSQLTAFPELDPGTDVNDRSAGIIERGRQQFDIIAKCDFRPTLDQLRIQNMHVRAKADAAAPHAGPCNQSCAIQNTPRTARKDRKSTRLNSSH